MQYWLFINAELNNVQCVHWICTREKNIVMQGSGEPDFFVQKQSQKSSVSVNNQVDEVFLVLPAVRVLLTEVYLPKGIAPEAQTLAYALEDRLSKDSSELIITRLSTKTATADTGKTCHKVSVLDKELFNQLQSYSEKLAISRFTITVDCLCLPISANHWSVWMSREGAVVRFSSHLGMGLMSGTEKFLLQRQLHESIAKNNAPEAITVLGIKEMPEEEAVAMKMVESWGINLPLVFQSVNMEDLLALPVLSIVAKSNSLSYQWQQWTTLFKSIQQGILRPILTLLLLMVVVWIIQFGKLTLEHSALQSQIEHNFYRVFSTEAVKTVHPVLQIEEKVRTTLGGGTSAKPAFSLLMLDIAKAMKQTTLQHPTKVSFQNNVLLMTFAKPVSLSVVSTLQSKWPRAQVLLTANTLTLSF